MKLTNRKKLRPFFQCYYRKDEDLEDEQNEVIRF